MKKIILIMFGLILFGCVSKNISNPLPSIDINGEDFKPRFPNSIRIGYSNSSCLKSATYYVKGNHTNEVISFYNGNVSVKFKNNLTFFNISEFSCENKVIQIKSNDSLNKIIKSVLPKAKLINIFTNGSLKRLDYLASLNSSQFLELKQKFNKITYSSFNKNSFSLSANQNNYFITIYGYGNKLFALKVKI